ncbi:MAG: rod shape-determining protein MreD [Candidatus Omnitrophota bacterium]
MRKTILIVLVILLAVLVDYTIVPVLPSPLNKLSFIILSFTLSFFYNPKLIVFYAVIIGFIKDILGPSQPGINTLTYIICAYLVILLSKWVIKDTIWTKILYTSFIILISFLVPILWEYFFKQYVLGKNLFAIEVIIKKLIINNLAMPVWNILFAKLLK